MSKVLVLVFGVLFSQDGRADGTRIRSFEIAKALKRKGHDVVIGQTVDSKEYSAAGLRVISVNKDTIADIASGFDVIVTYPNEFTFSLSKANIKKPIVMDIYDPRLVSDLFMKQGKGRVSASTMSMLKGLSIGDLFMCASDVQKTYYTGLLNILGKTDLDMKRLVIVPFGTPAEPVSECKGTPIFPEGKKIILWPGEFYPWFDPLTAIKAVSVISKVRDDVALAFVGSTHFQRNEEARELYEMIVDVCEKMEILDKFVFFVDWLPYETRGSMYNADVVLVTSKKSVESELSFRTRIIDSIWGGLPIVCTEGDQLSTRLESAGAGVCVHEADANDISKVLLEILESPAKAKKMAKSAAKLRDELSWDNAIRALDDFCRVPTVDARKNDIPLLKELPEAMQERIEEIYHVSQEDLKRMRVEHDKMVSENLKKFHEELQKSYSEKEKLQKEMEGLQMEIARLESELRISKAEVKHHQMQELSLKAEINFLKSKMEAEINYLKSKMDSEIKWRQEKIDSILNSRMYKYVCSPIWVAHNRIVKRRVGK